MEQQEPSLNIPQEQQPKSPEGEAVASVEFIPAASPETAPSSERTPVGSGNSTQPDQTVQAQPASQPAQHTAVQDDSSQSGNPTIADDVDVLEKEWVDKAKHIVETTKNDPHMQKQEVSKLKADYMKKRYGKDIKVINE